MPSKSYIDFLELQIDVDNLRITHLDYSKGKRGRKNLGFLTRSATVMLCAAWERYNENILLECIRLLISSGLKSIDMPKDVKKFLSRKVKEDKNEIKPIELADDGWKNLWIGYATNETEILNSPNSVKLNLLFKRFLGLEEYTNFWKKDSPDRIDQFVSIRGEIAHNGSKSKYVRFDQLLKFIDLTIDNAIEIDYNLSQFLKREYSVVDTWKETYYRNLKDYRRIK